MPTNNPQRKPGKVNEKNNPYKFIANLLYFVMSAAVVVPVSAAGGHPCARWLSAFLDLKSIGSSEYLI